MINVFDASKEDILRLI